MSAEIACAKLHYKVTHHDLPLSCPMKGMRLWDAHPKVYLAIEETCKAMCEYCGAHYELVDTGSADAAAKH